MMADLPVSKYTFASKPSEEGQKWRVELAWPNGEPEHVQDFDSEKDANAWIASMSQTWLRKRLDLT